jgi:hypothetical protein
MVQPWLAALSISYSVASSTAGRPWPPSSAAQASAGQPACQKAW